MIVAGEVSAPSQQIRDAQRTGNHDYVDISVGAINCLKGPCGSLQTLTLRYYTKGAPYNPDPSKIIAASGKKAMLFLAQVDEGDKQSSYFAGHTGNALQQYSAALNTRVRTLVNEQADIPRRIACMNIPANDTLYPKVKSLVDAMTSADSQFKAFKELEALGAPALPAMVSLMNDRRPLAYRQISLANHNPKAFEAVRHYGPQLTVDALAALANQIDGGNFGFIMNGGSERERVFAWLGWQIHLYRMLASDASKDKQGAKALQERLAACASRSG